MLIRSHNAIKENIILHVFFLIVSILRIIAIHFKLNIIHD